MKRHKVNLSPDASHDYFTILNELFDQRIGCEAKFAQAFDQTMTRLADFPEIGKLWRSAGSGLRSIAVWDYLLFYEVFPNEVIIRRVIHGARELSSLIDKEW